MTALLRFGTRHVWSVGLAVSACLAVACKDTRQSASPEKTRITHSESLRDSAPVVAQAEPTLTIGSFMDSLRAITGEFSSPDGVQWIFSGNERLLVNAGTLDDTVVDSLVACLGDVGASKATLNRQFVPQAIVCFEALRRTTIVPSAEDSDSAWAGYLTPSSGVDAIRKAHQAWSEVVRLKRYTRS